MSQEQPFLQQVRNTANVTLDVLLTNLSANIGTAYGQANLAYTTANAAYAQANVGVLIGEEAYAQANSAYAQANLAYTAGNSGISAAATALTVAEAAYGTANAGIAYSGVSAGTYGSGSQIPVVTLDYRGRVTSAYTTSYNQFTSSGSGIVPASGGGTTNFLRADGTWNAIAAVYSATLASNGHMYLASSAGNILVQWAVYGANINGDAGPYNFSFPVSFSNTPYCVVPITNAKLAFGLASSNSTSFGVYSCTGASTCTEVFVLAIGPA